MLVYQIKQNIKSFVFLKLYFLSIEEITLIISAKMCELSIFKSFAANPTVRRWQENISKEGSPKPSSLRFSGIDQTFFALNYDPR